MDKVTGKTVIIDVLRRDAETAEIFMKHGMHCVGCPSASGESIEAACVVHGLDPEPLIKDLNEFFASKGNQSK
ncbi:MAG: DUF1858 domain-containing protein [Clostridia bacterium]|nr:DUF1858 domain-containing protein [Clostridia bacterium]